MDIKQLSVLALLSFTLEVLPIDTLEKGGPSLSGLQEFSTNLRSKFAQSVSLNGNTNSEHSRRVRDTSQEEARRLFEAYYECMEKQKTVWSENKAVARLALQGQTVHLSCNLCLRPDQDVETYNIKWRRRLLSAMVEQPIHIDDISYILMVNKTLIMPKVEVTDSGQYVCYFGNRHQAIYQVDVVEREKYRTVFEPPDKGPRALPTSHLPDHNLMVVTRWSSWSRCNQCNKRGQRRRIGLCTVLKEDVLRPVSPKDVPYLDDYPDGLPCRSSLLPASISQLPEVNERSSESLLAYCFIDCPTLAPVKMFTDNAGNVIEVVHTNDGFVSMRDKPPKLPGLVKRQTIFQTIYRRIILTCPHDKSSDTNVHWQNGSQPIDAVLTRRKTRGRVTIDNNSRLRIRRLFMTDTAPYSCWIDGQHIATIKLRVTEKVRRDYKDYVVMAGFGAVVLILLIISCQLCCGRRRGQRGRSVNTD